MIRIFLGVFVSLVFLPALSFGQSIDAHKIERYCSGLMDAQGKAFLGASGEERDLFMKAHPDLVSQQDQMVKKTWNGKGSIPQISDPTYQAFLSKQMGDRQAFFAQLYSERDACIAQYTATGQPPTSLAAIKLPTMSVPSTTGAPSTSVTSTT